MRRRIAIEGDSGVALITSIALVTFLVTVASALGALSANNLRSAGRSDASMRAFYLADSGAQSGNAKLRVAGGLTEGTSFYETIAGQSAAVDMDPLSTSLHQVRSTATIEAEQVTVEILVEFIENSLLDAGFQVNVSNGVEVQDDEIPVWMTGDTVISGMDHSTTGTLLADQSGAVHGIALNPVPGETGVDVEIDVRSTPLAVVEGDPQDITNDADNTSETLDNLRNTAQSGADVYLTGASSLDTGDTGSYGTAGDPKTVCVSLGDNESLTIAGEFSGYGTLFIDVGRVDNERVLVFDGTSEWYGLIVVHFRDEVNMTNKALVTFNGTNKVVGGLVTTFSGPSVDFGANGEVLGMNGTDDIFYSSEAVETSPGVSVVVDRSAKMASYKVE